MKESLATFRKAVNESADLQEKLKGGTALVELGKENGYDFSQEDVTAAFEELWRSGEPWLNSMEAESGGSGSGSSGGSSFWRGLLRGGGLDRGGSSFEAESGGSGSGSSGGSFGWLWCSGSLLVAAAVCCVCGGFFASCSRGILVGGGSDAEVFFSSLGVAFWWLCGFLVAAAVAVGLLRFGKKK